MTIALERDTTQTVQQFIDLPPWLETAVNPESALQLLRTHIPELAADGIQARITKVSRFLLRNDTWRWNGTYSLEIEGAQSQTQKILVDAGLFAPNAPLPSDVATASSEPFGSSGWRLWLPEQRLLLTHPKPKSEEKTLPEPRLVDADQVRPLLERTLREQAEGYADVQIEACAVKVVSHKSGRTTVFRYQLTYPQMQAGRSWQDVIFGKYYTEIQGDKDSNAYEGLAKLGRSPLVHSDALAFPQALGYIPELRTVLLGPVPEECNFEDIVKRAVRGNDPAVWSELTDYARAAGVALAALHRSGVHHGAEFNWAELRADAGEQVERLSMAFPELMEGVERILSRIEELEHKTPADPPVPSHGSPRPEQILLYQGRVGLIDFDRFCMVEPSHDLSRFRVTLVTYGANARSHGYADRTVTAERIQQLEAVNQAFLESYEAHAPVSRERLALWEALCYIKDLLHTWSKVWAEDRSAIASIVETHLQRMGLR